MCVCVCVLGGFEWILSVLLLCACVHACVQVCVCVSECVSIRVYFTLKGVWLQFDLFYLMQARCYSLKICSVFSLSQSKFKKSQQRKKHNNNKNNIFIFIQLIVQ